MLSICFPVTGKGVVQSAPPENNTKNRKINGVYRSEDLKKTTLKFYYWNASWGECNVMVTQVNMLMVGTILQILTVAFVLVGNKEEPNHMWICFVFVSSDEFPCSPYILDIGGRDGMVIRRVIDLYGRVLLSSNNCNIMENNTCHSDVTCPLWVILSFCRHWNRDLSIPMVISTRALVLQWATLKHCRGPRVRVRGQQRGLAWIATIPQQVAIKLSCNYRGHIWVHLKRETTNFVQGFSFLTTCKSVAQTTLPVDPGVMHRARPFGFYICNNVSCITYLYSAENDMS